MEVVDLFAGPGGLSEGFRRLSEDDGTDLRIALSVEMDPWAVETLRTRAFATHADNHVSVLDELKSVRGSLVAEELRQKSPALWRAIEDEVRQLELGTSAAREVVLPKLDAIRERTNGQSILIGGPPCQAYSIVGRSRNRGNEHYVPEMDHRHFLYREYVEILHRLRPAAFVMENVKGILSSKVHGEAIFQRILDDLADAGDGYALLPLSSPISSSGSLDQSDFIVRSELHGVPQARHRVIILGVRSDLAVAIPEGSILLEPGNPEEATTVAEALAGLPALRSGVSSGDNEAAWRKAVNEHMKRISAWRKTPDEVRTEIGKLSATYRVAAPSSRSSLYSTPPGNQMPPDLADWLRADGRRVANHETRGHMSGDLARYLFAASFANVYGKSPKLRDFHPSLLPAHRNRHTGKFADRFRVQLSDKPSTTITSHISKDGHYYIHPDPSQCRSLTVREAARLQTFPDDYIFMGPRTEQYRQVGNAVPPLLAYRIAGKVLKLLSESCSRQLSSPVGFAREKVS